MCLIHIVIPDGVDVTVDEMRRDEVCEPPAGAMDRNRGLPR